MLYISIVHSVMGIVFTYHGENNTAPRNKFLEIRLGRRTQSLQRCATRHRAVGIQQAQCLFSRKVSLQIAGHCQAHGSEAVLVKSLAVDVSACLYLNVFAGPYPADLCHVFPSFSSFCFILGFGRGCWVCVGAWRVSMRCVMDDVLYRRSAKNNEAADLKNL